MLISFCLPVSPPFASSPQPTTIPPEKSHFATKDHIQNESCTPNGMRLLTVIIFLEALEYFSDPKMMQIYG